MESATTMRIVTLALLALLPAGCDGCRGGSGGADGSASAASASDGTGEPDVPPELDEAGEPVRRDASLRFRDAEPLVDAARAMTPADPACAGRELDLAAIVFDTRCASGSGEAKRLREPLEVDAGAPRFRQEAVLEAGGRVAVRVVSLAKTPLTIPLSHHAKLPAFSALAEDAAHHLYELEPPTLVANGMAEKPRIAKIELAPGGIAVARANLRPTIVRRIVPKCPPAGADGGPDAGGCGPGPLPAGAYTLYVGQLVVDVEVGAPAKLAWAVP